MIENTREEILKHETPEYIASRPDWVIGKVPDLSDYRKLSVENMEEAFLLARIGQEVTSQFIPLLHGKPLRLYFTQAMILGAAIITREIADKYHLNYEKYRSVLMLCPSRYGKSFLNAISLNINAGAAGKECQIGAATIGKAQIIQNKVVEMLPDTVPAIQDGLIVDSNEEDKYRKIKRLAVRTSKVSLKWSNGGSIDAFSTNENLKNADVGAAGAVGIGGDFAVLDEVQLMSPIGFRTASRFMVESNETKRFCVANPSVLGHLKELYDDPSTFVVHTNEVNAIIEGRFTRKSIALTGMPAYSPEYRSYVCVDEETECLTPSGWRSIKDIKKGDIIAQIGDNESLEFVPIKGKIEKKSPNILQTSFAHDDWMFTPDHRQYAYYTSPKTKKTEKKVYRIANLPKASHIRILCGGQNQKEETISSMDRLAIALQADGSIETEYKGRFADKPIGKTKWRVSFVKQRKIDRFRYILEDCKIDYYERKLQSGQVRFSFTIDSKITKNLSDWFGWNIGAERARGIIDEVLEWDGCKVSHSYSTTQQSNADFIQAVAAQCSVRTTLSTGKMWNGNTLYRVHIHKSNIRTTFHLKRKEMEWNKPVYCVTVPSGEWLARRHGHIINTGNCVEFPEEGSGNRFFPTMPAVYDKDKFEQPVRKLYFMGIDSAYQGGDSIMVTIFSLNETLDRKWFVVEKQIDVKERFKGEWTPSTTVEICLDILKLWEKYSVMAACIDIGFGIHIYEKLREINPGIPLEPITYTGKPTPERETDYNAKFALNKRAEMHLDLRDLSQPEVLYIAPDCYEELVREMQEINQSPTKQKIQIEAKKDIKARLGRSPDALDSLCLAVHAMVLSGVLTEDAATIVSDNLMEVIS